jgi:AcrR family transcriptional regulator
MEKKKVGSSRKATTVGSLPKRAGSKPETMTGTKEKSSLVTGDRRTQLLNHAARLFSESGFDQTSMRDIAAAFGILPGSLYHHFGSKEELFIAVYIAGVNRFVEKVEAAAAQFTDPWARLEAACVAHLEELLMQDSPAAAVLADRCATTSKELRKTLIKERDRYETIFKALTDAVDLPKGVQTRYFRLGLLGALNWSLTWFQDGGDKPAVIALHLLASFRPK